MLSGMGALRPGEQGEGCAGEGDGRDGGEDRTERRHTGSPRPRRYTEMGLFCGVSILAILCISNSFDFKLTTEIEHKYLKRVIENKKDNHFMEIFNKNLLCEMFVTFSFKFM